MKATRTNPIIDGHRTCTQCDRHIPIQRFGKNSQSSTGYHPWCKDCRAKSRKAHYEADPERAIENQTWRSLKHRYGLTRHEYVAKFEAQGGRCAICAGTQIRRLSVDHDHACCPIQRSCGECIRDLLCTTCNMMLGLAGDDTDRLLAAVDYLRRWSPSQ